MQSIAKLKELARAHEQKEEWDQAIQAYLKILRQEEEAEDSEADLGLYNRIGDLYVRLGRPADAVNYYEQAADLYAGAGLYNNAIALCNKALRHLPGRAHLYRKLGRLSLKQGFLTDARRWFLEYADRMRKVDALDEAFHALEEFAELSDDAEIREMLGHQLHAHERDEEALAQLRVARRMRLQAGETEAAQAIAEAIRGIDPDADTTAPEPAAAGDAGAARRPDSPRDPHAIELSGLDADEPGTDDADSAEPLPLLGADDAPIEEAPIEEAQAVEPEAEEPAVESEVASATRRARELDGAGRRAEAVETLERTHRELAAAGRYRDAVAVVEVATEIQPDAVDAHQRRVEYAFRLEERPLLVAAYLGLGACLGRLDKGGAAEAVYERILTIDPGNAEAQKALRPPEPARAPAGDYVNLNSLLLEDDDARESTRFVVPETEPTGDEERDFSEMLSQFKSKVAEHVSAEDTSSHYDLGLAYKEMGLLDEAIAEFQIALRNGSERLKLFEELGRCFMLKEQYTIAARVLDHGLRLSHDDETDLRGVYYQLGRCHEELGDATEARSAYERVVGFDIDFRDVAERLTRL